MYDRILSTWYSNGTAYFCGDEKLPINEADKLLHRGVKFKLSRPLPKILLQRTNTCSLRAYYISIGTARWIERALVGEAGLGEKADWSLKIHFSV